MAWLLAGSLGRRVGVAAGVEDNVARCARPDLRTEGSVGFGRPCGIRQFAQTAGSDDKFSFSGGA